MSKDSWSGEMKNLFPKYLYFMSEEAEGAKGVKVVSGSTHSNWLNATPGGKNPPRVSLRGGDQISSRAASEAENCNALTLQSSAPVAYGV